MNQKTRARRAFVFMARPEGVEPPTAWFVVSKLIANFLFLIVITGTPVAHFA